MAANNFLLKIGIYDFGQKLIENDSIFERIFNSSCFDDLPADQKEESQKRYDDLIRSNRENLNFDGDTSLCDFIKKYQEEVRFDDSFEENVCLNPPRYFDAKNKKTVNFPTVLAPQQTPPSTTSRGRPEEFNVYKFLCDNVQYGFPLSLDKEMEEEDWNNDELSYGEKINLDNQADHNLRKIARLIMVLNQQRGGYKVMDCYSEKRLHRL